MMSWENRLLDWLRKHVWLWACLAAALLGAFIRYSFLPMESGDLKYMNLSWYNAIKAGGLAAVFEPGLQWTYSPLHLYLWGLTAWLLPGAPGMETLKCVSLLMEVALIAAACLLVWRVSPEAKKKPYAAIAFILLCLDPLTLLNAAGWGQTDASYVALSLLAIWLLLRNKHAWAMVCLGLALGFKLQAIFLLPLFLMYDLCERKFSLLWFLLVPAVWVLTGVPVALLGQSPLYAVTVYLGQTSLYVRPTFNCPNVFALLGDAMSGDRMIQGMWSRLGISLAIASLGGMAAWLMARRKRFDERFTLLLGAWCVLACVFFLPRMHERYGLAGEILLLCWAVCSGRPRGFAYVLLGLLPPLSAYCEYLFKCSMFPLQLGAAMNLVLLALLTWEVVRDGAPVGAEAPRERRVRA